MLFPSVACRLAGIKLGGDVDSSGNVGGGRWVPAVHRRVMMASVVLSAFGVEMEDEQQEKKKLGEGGGKAREGHGKSPGQK